WAPFASKRDWCIAKWAIEEGIGNGKLDRLLEIEGVVESLGLSFRNAAGLHKHVDSMPSEAPWSTRDIVFSDQPNDHYTVQYRDVIDGVKALLGDPSLADKLVYRPKRVF
ncbi:uncharacterized protein STEHIDRAFT_36669, partial [Stereum hirsutum FP-91666 SS1]